MRITVIYRDEHVFVEYPPDVFTKLLTTYLKTEGTVAAAMERIERELRKETQTR